MLGLKKQFIKNKIRYKLEEQSPGKIIVSTGFKEKIPEEYKVYEPFIVEVIKVLPGIEQIEPDYDHNQITLIYDPEQLDKVKINRWINLLIDVTLDYIEPIKKYGETNTEQIVQSMKQTLSKKLNLMGKL